MLVCDRLADAADDLIDLEVAAMHAFHLLYQDELFFVVFGQHRECSPAVPPQRWMAAADRPYDRSGAPASSRDQHRRFGHAVEGTHHPRLEAVRTKRGCKLLDGICPHGFGGVE